MNKGKIIFYDDDPEIISQFETLMADTGFQIERYTELDNLRKAINEDHAIFDNTKAMIFDLARSQAEGGLSNNFEILKDIEDKFHKYRIPIFIHSAFANNIPNFENNGTVWKIEKSGTSLESIYNTINSLDESGFLDAFTPNGIIEQSLFEELHKSFTEQFRKGEIEKVIASIKKEDPNEFKTRAIQVFKKLAVKSLMSSLLSPLDAFSPIEHYYRRISNIDIWTGDVWTKKDKMVRHLIITPRCNVANKGVEKLMIINIINDFPTDNKKDKIKRALVDNPDFSGTSLRYLPPSPIFSGGRVDFSTCDIISKDILLSDYELECTLSDELTNEILGKFGAYFLRTGITPFDLDEMITYIDSLKENAKQ